MRVVEEGRKRRMTRVEGEEKKNGRVRGGGGGVEGEEKKNGRVRGEGGGVEGEEKKNGSVRGEGGGRGRGKEEWQC